MHPIRIGRIVRTLRRRRGWRQVDLAAKARVSQQAVSLIETGQCRRLAIDTLDRVLAALEAEVELVVRWRGGELDRILDSGHAALEAGFAGILEADGWLVALEVTYARGGDRGSIDLLAFHPEHAALLVGEIKSDVTSAEGTLRKHDEKVRVGAAVARERFGWAAASVSRLLVLPEASTARRRIRSNAPIFDRAYPARGHGVRQWLRRPLGQINGLLFLSPTKMVGDRRDLASRRRVARPRGGQVERGATDRVDGTERGFIDSTAEHQQDW